MGNDKLTVIKRFVEDVGLRSPVAVIKRWPELTHEYLTWCVDVLQHAYADCARCDAAVPCDQVGGVRDGVVLCDDCWDHTA